MGGVPHDGLQRAIIIMQAEEVITQVVIADFHPGIISGCSQTRSGTQKKVPEVSVSSDPLVVSVDEKKAPVRIRTRRSGWMGAGTDGTGT